MKLYFCLILTLSFFTSLAFAQNSIRPANPRDVRPSYAPVEGIGDTVVVQSVPYVWPAGSEPTAQVYTSSPAGSQPTQLCRSRDGCLRNPTTAVPVVSERVRTPANRKPGARGPRGGGEHRERGPNNPNFAVH